MTPETNGKGNNVVRDEWQTPEWLFSKLETQYRFHFDCCANNNNKKCEYFSNNFEEEEYINLTAWMNPPFSKAYKMFEHFMKVVTKGVAIYRCDNLETKLWQTIIIPNADWIFIPNKRINYEGADGKGARFPSALIGIGLQIPDLSEGMLIKKI